MLQKLLSNKITIVQFFVLVGLFALVRALENKLFYDPFLDYFKLESLALYPKFEFFRLYFSLLFRYVLNTITSLGILFVFFRDVDLLKFASILYLIFFIILIVGFAICLEYFDESHRMTLFYIRRFIIQPIFILLFIPAFYFQKSSNQ